MPIPKKPKKVSARAPASAGKRAPVVAKRAPVVAKRTPVAASPAAALRPSLQMPPADANIPSPPHGFPEDVPPGLRGVKPRTSEINAINAAVSELRGFVDYPQTFGTTAPRYDVLLRSLDRAAAWSTMRVTLAKWDAYASVQEAHAWKDNRRLLSQLRRAYELAAHGNERLKSQFPNLRELLFAMKAIGRKGAASRQANKQAEAEGKPPVRGKRAKAARRAAAQAAFARAEAAKAEKKAAKG